MYDEKGRVIRTYKTNYQGGFHQTDMLLDFSGKVNTTFTSHKYRPSDTPVEIEERYFYSPQDRLEMIQHIINNTYKEMILKNEYDALGQLISKRVGGDSSVSEDGYQKIDYRYNIRGWLTDINEINALNAGSGLFEDLFAFQIRYDNPDGHYNGEVDALYNGNISETFWISNTDGVLRKYGYKYDPLNRLKDAYFQRPYSINPVCSSYDEYLSYDKNGNILSLIRNGHLESVFQPNLIDELEYFYQGNRLTRVTDHSENPNGFKDDENNTNDPDYLYDDFGNMVYDENKKIELIEYNHLNLPTSIVFGTGAHITYLYNAAGQKLRKTVFDGPPLYRTSITEYLDGFQYNNEVLQFFSHPEGYVLNTPDSQGNPSYDYVYQYKDHLGNIRMNFVFDSDAADLKVLEENHYYPFGLKHENYNVTKKKMKWESELIGGEEMELKRVRQVPNSGYQYKYNGKEWQDELGLNVYDYGARHYDPAVGRWFTIDPLAEQGRRWTPYNYAFDNPVYFIDPDGMWPFPTGSFINLVKTGKKLLSGLANSTTNNNTTKKPSSSGSSGNRGGVMLSNENGGRSGQTDLIDNGGRRGDELPWADFSGFTTGAFGPGGPRSGRTKGDGRTNATSNTSNTASRFGDGVERARTVFGDPINAWYNLMPDKTSNETSMSSNPSNENTNASSESSSDNDKIQVEVKDTFIYTDAIGDFGNPYFFLRTGSKSVTVEIPNNSNSLDSVRKVYSDKEQEMKNQVNSQWEE